MLKIRDGRREILPQKKQKVNKGRARRATFFDIEKGRGHERRPTSLICGSGETRGGCQEGAHSRASRRAFRAQHPAAAWRGQRGGDVGLVADGQVEHA
jgi:hypothetical protein